MSIDRDTIQEIGVWTMRLALVVGAIIGGMNGNENVMGGCIVALIFSFFFFLE